MARVAVVFVHYAMPQERLDDHFRWNGELYQHAGAAVYVVTDTEMRVPDGARCVVVPQSMLPLLDGKPCFSLAMSKNAGIRAALGDGCDPIIVTDSDVAFPAATWQRMLQVRRREAVVPIYLMARTYEDRNPPDLGMTGTIAMKAERWRGVGFDERCIGYGAEDGVIHRAMRAESIGLVPLRRDVPYVWHMAHDPENHLLRAPGHGSPDCWNRDTINPDNFNANRRVK